MTIVQKGVASVLLGVVGIGGAYMFGTAGEWFVGTLILALSFFSIIAICLTQLEYEDIDS